MTLDLCLKRMPRKKISAIRQRTEQQLLEYPIVPRAIPAASKAQIRNGALPDQITVSKTSVYQRAHSYHAEVPPDAIIPVHQFLS